MNRNKRILVIDDDPYICISLKKILEPEGYSIWTKESAVEAFHYIDKIKPDLIILDMRLPILGGIDFLNIVKIKEIPAKVILMTGFDDMTRDRAIFMGATGFIHKPFRAEVIKRLVSDTMDA